MGNVFFSRCRPQSSDPINVVVKERRVFIGYPAWRRDIPEDPDPRQLRKWIIDLRCPEEEWQLLKPGFGKDSKQYQQNRNLALEIERRDIALVPRPSLGVVYAARVLRPFELLNDPRWAVKSLPNPTPISRSIATPLARAELAFDRVVFGKDGAVGKWPAGATVESLA